MMASSSKRDGGQSSTCFCGAHVNPSNVEWTCVLCKTRFHEACLKRQFKDQNAERWERAVKCKSEFVCARCRLKHLDSFFPVKEAMTQTFFVEQKRASQEEVNITFDGAMLQKFFREHPNVLVHLRDFSAPHWPYSMGFYLNGIERSDGSTGKAFIPPPQHGHVRKERPHIDLTKLPIAGSVNKLRLVCKYYTGNEPLEGGAEPRGFAFGLFWCKASSSHDVKQKILVSMRSRDHQNKPGKKIGDRISQFLEKRQQHGTNDDEIQFVAENVDTEGKSFSLNCPISGCPIEVPTISRNCESQHLQTFDLDSFIMANNEMRNLRTRWKCPVCQSRARAFDLRFCKWTAQALQVARKKYGDDLEDIPDKILLDNEGTISWNYAEAKIQERLSKGKQDFAVLNVDEEKEEEEKSKEKKRKMSGSPKKEKMAVKRARQATPPPASARNNKKDVIELLSDSD